MITKELFEFMKYGTAGRHTGRLSRLQAAISTAGKTPLYQNPVDERAIAWVLITYFLCPSSSLKTVVNWIEEREKDWEQLPVEQHPILKLSLLLRNAKDLAKIRSITIDKTWGVLSFNSDKGPFLEIATRSIPDNYKLLSPIREIAFVSGDFIQQLAIAANLYLFPELTEEKTTANVDA